MVAVFHLKHRLVGQCGIGKMVALTAVCTVQCADAANIGDRAHIRWVPNLDDDAQHDDSIAYEQAEREFQEEYPSEFGSASISGGGLGHSASMMVLQKAEEQNEELVALKVMSRPDALLHKLVLQGRRELTKRARRRSESLHEVSNLASPPCPCIAPGPTHAHAAHAPAILFCLIFLFRARRSALADSQLQGTF
jgi:hypothetical protein